MSEREGGEDRGKLLIILTLGSIVLGGGCRTSPHSRGDLASDLAAIEALHQRDEFASEAQDPDALATLWTEDGVMIAPGAARLRGPELFAALRAKKKGRAEEFEVLDYTFEFEEVEVTGDYAFEWGVVRGETRHRKTGRVEVSAFQLMRILRRKDGEWKVHRAIWNDLTTAR